MTRPPKTKPAQVVVGQRHRAASLTLVRHNSLLYQSDTDTPCSASVYSAFCRVKVVMLDMQTTVVAFSVVLWIIHGIIQIILREEILHATVVKYTTSP